MGEGGLRRYFCRGLRADLNSVIHEGLLHSKLAMKAADLCIFVRSMCVSANGDLAEVETKPATDSYFSEVGS